MSKFWFNRDLNQADWIEKLRGMLEHHNNVAFFNIVKNHQLEIDNVYYDSEKDTIIVEMSQPL